MVEILKVEFEIEEVFVKPMHVIYPMNMFCQRNIRANPE